MKQRDIEEIITTREPRFPSRLAGEIAFYAVYFIIHHPADKSVRELYKEIPCRPHEIMEIANTLVKRILREEPAGTSVKFHVR